MDLYVLQFFVDVRLWVKQLEIYTINMTQFNVYIRFFMLIYLQQMWKIHLVISSSPHIYICALCIEFTFGYKI